MWGLIGSIAAAAISAVAGLISAKDNRKHNKQIMREQNKFNAEQAQIAREWNQQVDSDKYQRQVADMQAAGVNPALAMNGGVTTQATSSAQASSASAMPANLDLGGIIATALQAKQLKIQERLARSQEAKNYADAAKTGKETSWIDELNSASVANIKAQASKAFSDINVNSSTIEVNGVKMDLYNAQTGLFDAQMSKTEKEQQLVEVQTAISNLDKEKLQIILPYVQAQQQASLALQNAQTEKAKQEAITAYTQASLNLANASVSEGIVSSGYYEKLGGKLDADTKRIEADEDLVRQQIKTEEWNTKQAKRNYKWTGVNNAINATCKVATTACAVAGTVMTGGVGGALVKPSGDLGGVVVPKTVVDPRSIYTGSGDYKAFVGAQPYKYYK